MNEEAKNWLAKRKIDNWIQDVNTKRINVEQDVQLFGYDVHEGQTKEFPIEFGIVKGDFVAAGIGLNRFNGSPTLVTGGCNFNNNTAIKSLEYITPIIHGSLRIQRIGVTSLHDIHKHIKSIGRFLAIDETIESNILGVILIKNLVAIELIKSAWPNTKLCKAVDIVNSYLENNKTEETRDLLQCQEEMIEAGLTEYAKL